MTRDVAGGAWPHHPYSAHSACDLRDILSLGNRTPMQEGQLMQRLRKTGSERQHRMSVPGATDTVKPNFNSFSVSSAASAMQVFDLA
jgi:hypothetical protein